MPLLDLVEVHVLAFRGRGEAAGVELQRAHLVHVGLFGVAACGVRRAWLRAAVRGGARAASRGVHCLRHAPRSVLNRSIELAKEKNCQPIQIALSYVVNLEISAYPLVGPRNFFELDSCIDATNIELSTQDLRYLETGN